MGHPLNQPRIPTWTVDPIPSQWDLALGNRYPSIHRYDNIIMIAERFIAEVMVMEEGMELLFFFLKNFKIFFLILFTYGDSIVLYFFL